MTTPKKIHLSVVATSRNDNHGGSLTERMQYFVDGFVEQCIRHDLQAELILVEWNPPAENCSLAEVLKFPKEKGPCAIRIITVPHETHQKLQHADQLPLFQMIAKNVGIRRALGDFVLATNIDILFSDEVMHYLKNKLNYKFLYRVDRLDIPSTLPKNATMPQLLAYAKNEAFRINGKRNTYIKKNDRWVPHRSIKEKSRILFSKFGFNKGFVRLYYNKLKNYLAFHINTYLHGLHANACGDFTLLSKKNWEVLRGYPEWEIHSWHMDTVLLHQARYQGIKEIDLPRKQCIYHIEHQIGSGYTPEGVDILFSRLKDKKIKYLSDDDLKNTIETMKQKKKVNKPLYYNNENWGFLKENFKEIWV
jgi:hypothetical protein